MTNYDDDLNVPEFMQQQRRPVTKEVVHYKEPINGRVTNINRPALTRMQHKIKIRKRRAIAGVLITSHFLAAIIGATIADKLSPTTPQPSIPTGYVLTEVKDRVDSGDTITGIASEYYDPSSYSGMYGSIEAYTQAILEQNGLKDFTTIYPGQAVTIPVVINSGNEIYIRMNVLKDAIKTISRENLWVEHTVGAGDTYSSLAAMASGSVNETYEIIDRIMEKNRGARFWPGDTVWIMNPALGPLKIELAELEQALQDSLKTAEMTEGQKTH